MITEHLLWAGLCTVLYVFCLLPPDVSSGRDPTLRVLVPMWHVMVSPTWILSQAPRLESRTRLSVINAGSVPSSSEKPSWGPCSLHAMAQPLNFSALLFEILL